MTKKPVDKTKKSNIKCEHCAFWMYETWFKGKGCTCLDSPKYKQSTNYWNRCKCFEWKGRGSMTKEERKTAVKEFKEWRDSYYNKNKLPATMFIEEAIKALEQEPCENMGEVSDGYHTFNQLYHQRAVLFATIVNEHPEISWKSFKHSDGHYCFDEDGEMFIVGIDTPEGSYTYHYHKKYWDLFKCKELERGKEWDGHTEKDVTRLLSLKQEPKTEWIPVSERLPEDRREVLVTAYWHETYQVMMASYFGDDLWWCVPFNNCGEHMQRLKPKAWMPLPEPYKAESEGE